MSRSARALGQEHNLTAQEMNFLLKEEGFLDGEPGAYGLTEKGLEYAQEEHHHRGVGGYGFYNRHWDERTWNEGITDEIDLSEERKNEIRQALTTARREKRELRNQDSFTAEEEPTEEEAPDGQGIDPRLLAGVIATLLAAYGIYKATPFIVRIWREKVTPGLGRLKNRLSGKEKESEGTAARADESSSPDKGLGAASSHENSERS